MSDSDPAARPADLITTIPTGNPSLTGPWGLRTLTNPSLDNLTLAVLQHGAAFGLLCAFRWFQPRKVLDLYYLCLFLALSDVFAALLFLWDRSPVTQIKLNFFLEHEVLEMLVASKVILAPGLAARSPGVVLMASWGVLFALSVAVALTDRYEHGADIVIWGLFVADAVVSVAGVKLIWVWARSVEVIEPFSRRTREIKKRLLRVDAVAGLAMVAHGVCTMPIPPIYTLVVYNGLNPDWYSYAWFAAFCAIMLSIALFVPAAMVFFGRVQCCCGRPRGAFPDIEWAFHVEHAGSANSSKTTHDVQEIPKLV